MDTNRVLMHHLGCSEATLPLNTAGSYNNLSGSWSSRTSTPTPADAGFKSAFSHRQLHGHHLMTAPTAPGSAASQPAAKGFTNLGGGRMGSTAGRTLGVPLAGPGSAAAAGPANYASRINQRSASLGASSRSLSSESLGGGGSTMRAFKKPRFNAPRPATPAVTATAARPAAAPGSHNDDHDARLLAEAEADTAASAPLFHPASPSPPPDLPPSAPVPPARRPAPAAKLSLPETRQSKGVRGVMRFPLPPPPPGEERLTTQGELLERFAAMERVALEESRVGSRAAGRGGSTGKGTGEVAREEARTSNGGRQAGRMSGAEVEVVTLSDSE